MASRLLYGMAREDVVPRAVGRVWERVALPGSRSCSRAAIAAGLIIEADLGEAADTTVALFVIVFAIVNVTVLYLRRDPVDHEHFKVPSVFPVLGVGVSIALLTQIEGETFARAGILVGIGVALWLLNELAFRRSA